MVSAVTQTGLQAATLGQGVAASSQVGMQVAFAPPATRSTVTTQAGLQAATAGQAVPATAQLAMLVAYRTGTVENLNLRSWAFDLDGHTFYVLTLGEQGTWVYDSLTGQWAQWQTQGLTGWNMELGTTWRNDVIALDQQNPILWRLDPTSFIDDDFRTQIRRVTGALSTRLRNFPANYAFRVTASLGDFDVANTAPPTQPNVTLRYSDDQGMTFTSAGDVTIEANNFTQSLQWLSLGVMQSPVRVFEITDTGAVVRLQGADAEVDENG